MPDNQNPTQVTPANDAVQAPVEGQAPDAPSLTVDDLKNSLQIIDVAVERKAFGGWNELMQIKVVRDRIATFVNFVSPPEEAPKAAAKGKKTAKTVAKPVAKSKK